MANLPPREVATNKAHLMSLAMEVLRSRDDIDEWDVFQHLTQYLNEQDNPKDSVRVPVIKPLIAQDIDEAQKYELD